MRQRTLWPGSLRLRITLLALLGVGVTLTIAAWGLLAVLEHSLISNDDNLSRARALDLAQQARAGSLPLVITNIGDDSLAQVVTEDGEVLAASAGLTDADPIVNSLPVDRTLSVQEMHGVPDDSESESYRVWSMSVDTADGRTSVFVGASQESVSETIAVLRRALVIGVPTILLALGLGTTFLVGRALKPVEAIRREVSTISANELDRRIPLPPNDDEVRRLAVTMNTMLERLQSARLRQLEFVADASHELQSPIAAFRAQLEVARANLDSTDFADLTSSVLSDVSRMEQLVHDLLYLARDELGSVESSLVPVDLDVIIAEEVARTIVPDGVELDAAGVSASPMRGVPAQLGRLFRNIIDNAIRHASHHVRVWASVVEDRVVVIVEDDGSGIPAGDREHIFERFVRLDSSRSRQTGGAGLGLAIARGIVTEHAGTIGVEDSQASRSGARFVVTFPVDGPTAPAT